MMNKEFELIVILKIQDLVALIMETNKVELVEALEYLYQSKLYTAMIDESTKLWHLSTEKLFEMLLIEKETFELIYPDFV